ncbi:MAG TPA: ChaN family lipoprotein [Phycisphaerales bacterium]|nr:ChaN family lipoprotein [Phycisphaerales bacterium]
MISYLLSHQRRLLTILSVWILSTISLAGCHGGPMSSSIDGSSPENAVPSGRVVSFADPREFPVFIGASGIPLSWQDVLDRASHAQVIVIGELHDDTHAHDLQLAILQDILKQNPRAALSLEFLERNQQIDVDDYLDDIIDVEALLDRLGIRSLEARASWKASYIRLIDAAKSAHAPVTAANAPRRYVRLARTDGYDRLKQLPADRRAMFDFPITPVDSPYKDRFFDLMSQSAEGDSNGHASNVAASFRSQRMWDATMAQSIVNTLRHGASQVVHVIGRFHVDEQGGTVLELRSRLRSFFSTPRVLTISCVQSDSLTLADEDLRRADIVFHTGARPPEPEDQAETQPTATAPEESATQPASSPEQTSDAEQVRVRDVFQILF